MSDIASEVVKLDARVAEINSELESLLQEHDVHEAAEKEAQRRKAENVAKRMSLRKEREGLSRLRDSAQVKHRIVTQEEAAAKAKAENEALTAKLAEQSKELDVKLAEVEKRLAAIPQSG